MMSPRLARVDGLVFFVYNHEEHQRPHVQVRASEYPGYPGYWNQRHARR
jgi:hypothetical protein